MPLTKSFKVMHKLNRYEVFIRKLFGVIGQLGREKVRKNKIEFASQHFFDWQNVVSISSGFHRQ